MQHRATLPVCRHMGPSNPRRNVAHRLLLHLFPCKPTALCDSLALISLTAYLFVLCWFPLHFNCSLSCSWSNHRAEFYLFGFQLASLSHAHTQHGADWHHLTSPCFLISIWTVYQQRNRFGVRVLSVCMSLCVSHGFFPPCPVPAIGHHVELPETAQCCFHQPDFRRDRSVDVLHSLLWLG